MELLSNANLCCPRLKLEETKAVFLMYEYSYIESPVDPNENIQYQHIALQYSLITAVQYSTGLVLVLYSSCTITVFEFAFVKEARKTL